MGFKPWRYLSLLAFAGVVLVGCNTTNPRDKYVESKGPPPYPQTTQRPGATPGIAGANPQSAFPLNGQPKGSPFGPGSSASIPNSAAHQQPMQSPYNQNAGIPVSNQAPGVPQIPNFSQMPPQSNNGAPTLPTNVANSPLPPNSAIFQNPAPTNVPRPSGFGQ